MPAPGLQCIVPDPTHSPASRLLELIAVVARSHAPRGNASPDAPRQRPLDAKRPDQRYHAERGNDHEIAIAGKVVGQLLCSFPRSAWECIPRRSASAGCPWCQDSPASARHWTQSVRIGVTTRSVGTIFMPPNPVGAGCLLVTDLTYRQARLRVRLFRMGCRRSAGLVPRRCRKVVAMWAWEANPQVWAMSASLSVEVRNKVRARARRRSIR
jgi:hypothetical protein